MKLGAKTLKEKLPWAIEEQVQKSQEEIRRKNYTAQQLRTEYNRQNDKYIKTLVNTTVETSPSALCSVKRMRGSL